MLGGVRSIPKARVASPEPDPLSWATRRYAPSGRPGSRTVTGDRPLPDSPPTAQAMRRLPELVVMT